MKYERYQLTLLQKYLEQASKLDKRQQHMARRGGKWSQFEQQQQQRSNSSHGTGEYFTPEFLIRHHEEILLII